MYEARISDNSKGESKKKERIYERHSFVSSKTQNETRRAKINKYKVRKDSNSENYSDKTSSLSNVSSNIRSLSNVKEKKIQLLNEMAVRLTKTIEEEEEAFDDKFLKRNMSDISKRESIKKYESRKRKISNDGSMTVEEAMSKLKSILPDPNIKMESENNFYSKANDIDLKEKKYYLTSNIQKSNQHHIGITHLGASFDPVKFRNLKIPNMGGALHAITPLPSSKKQKYDSANIKNHYSFEEIKAATIIQAHYRGHQVRKITSSLLKCAQNRRFKKTKCTYIRPLKDVPISHLAHITNKKSNYKVTDLPKNVKSFYDLAESGDINTFTESYLKAKCEAYDEKKIQNLTTISDESTDFSPNADFSGSKSLMKNCEEYSKSIPKEKDSFLSSKNDEIDLKIFCRNKISSNSIFQPKSQSQNDKSNTYDLSSLKSSKEEPVKKMDLIKLKPAHKNISINNSTSCDSYSRISPEFFSYSSSDNTILSSSQNKSLNIEARKGNVCFKDISRMISPSHLTSRINAELVFQDTVGSALNHLQDLQNIRAISKAQELSINHFSKLHTFPKVQDKCLNTENSEMLTNKSEHNHNRNKLQEDIDKMEKESQMRITKLEEYLKDKVEKIFEKTSKIITSKFEENTHHPTLSDKPLVKNVKLNPLGLGLTESTKLREVNESIMKSLSDSTDKSDCSISSVIKSLNDPNLPFSEKEFSQKKNDDKWMTNIQSSNLQANKISCHSLENLEDSIETCDVKSFQSKKSSKLCDIIHSEATTTITTTTTTTSTAADDFSEKQTHTSYIMSNEAVIKSSVSNVHLKHVSNSLTVNSTNSSIQTLSSEIHSFHPISSRYKNENNSVQDLLFSNKNIDYKSLNENNSVQDLPFSNNSVQDLLFSNKNIDYKSLNPNECLSPTSGSVNELGLSESGSLSPSKGIGSPNTPFIAHDSYQKNLKIEDSSGTCPESFDSVENTLTNLNLHENDIQKRRENSVADSGEEPFKQKRRENSVAGSGEEPFKSIKGGALQSMLNLLLSLQKEEEIRYKHQMAVFKLQEQFLIEEARLKLISMSSEGGVNLRKRQRAIFLQLREQRSHIKRLIETQNLAAQQRQLFFSQHYNLLLSTSNSGNKAVSSRTNSPISNLEFSSSEGFENSSSNSSISKSLRRIGFNSSLRDDAPKKKLDIITTSTSAEEENVCKSKHSIKKESLKTRQESVKNDRQLNFGNICTEIDERNTTEVKNLKKYILKKNFQENSSVDSKEQQSNQIKSKDYNLNSNVNYEKDKESFQIISDNQYLSSSKLSEGKKEEINLSPCDRITSEKAKSDTELMGLENVYSLKNRQKSKLIRKNSDGLPFPLRCPLSPRSSLQNRRQSSESDDSFNLSQNDTISDMSDCEGRLVALKEELELRKTEADRLKKERRRIIKERILSQEQALRSQIAKYDSYIEQKKLEIENESQKLLKVNTVKPLIKKPQASPGKLHLNESHNLSQSVCDENLLENSLNSINTSTAEYSVSYSNTISDKGNIVDVIPGLNEKSTEIGTFVGIKVGEFTNSQRDESNNGNKSNEICSISHLEEEQLLPVKEQKSDKTDEITVTESDLAFKEHQYLENKSDSEPEEDLNLSPKENKSEPIEPICKNDLEKEKPEILKADIHVEKFINEEDTSNYAHQEMDKQEPELDTQVLEKEKEEKSLQIQNLKKKADDVMLKEKEKSLQLQNLKKKADDVMLKEKEKSLQLQNLKKKADDVMLKEKEKSRQLQNLKKKADDVADYILHSLVKDSILCIKHLLRGRNKPQVIIFDIINQSDEPLVGCEALNRDFESFVKTKTTVENNISSLEVDYLPDTMVGQPLAMGKSVVKETFTIDEKEDQAEHKSLLPDEQNKKNSTYNSSCSLANIQNSPSEFYKGTDINETFSVSSCEGAWLEGEFWKSEEHIKTQKELREEEELINAEIARLEELQRFKEKYPNLVIREVPDKPPPPYTPPKEAAPSTSPEKIKLPEPQTPSNTISVPHRLSKADLRKIASDIVNVVPSEEELLSIVEKHCNYLYSEWQKGRNPAYVDYPSLNSIKDSEVEDADTSEISEAAFNYLIFNLTRQFVCEVFHYLNSPPPPVWTTHFHIPKIQPWKIPRNITDKSLTSHVLRNVSIVLGIDSTPKRESAMMKWALKRKEPVDQIIIQEFQTEETSWIQYLEEEAFVKTQISNEILSSLIDDTVCVFKNILTKFF